jgi:hypothetical protein
VGDAGRSAAPVAPVTPLPQSLTPSTTPRDVSRRLSLVAAAVAALAAVLGGVVLLGRDEAPRVSSVAVRAAPAATPATGGHPSAFVDAIVGTYVGEIIADSKGSSRSGVSVRLDKLSADTVRVSSSHARIGSLDITVMPMAGKVSNAGGGTPLQVDLEASPPTLVLDPHGELAFRGIRQQ